MNQEEYGEQRHRLWTHTSTIQYYVQKHGQLSVCVYVFMLIQAAICRNLLQY